MSADKTFLLPVAIDNTPQTDERIPDRFRELQCGGAPLKANFRSRSDD